MTEETVNKEKQRNGEVQRRVARDSGPAQPAPHATKRATETQTNHAPPVCVSGVFSLRDPLRGSVARCSVAAPFASPLLRFSV